MIDPNFFNLVDDTIGVLKYYYNKDINVSDQQKDKLHLQNSSAYVNKFIHDMIYNPKSAGDPHKIFFEARKETNKLIEDNSNITIEKVINVQLNKSIIEDLKQIESDPNFRGWEYPYFIEEIKNKFS